jgi:beta-N-acetylhexosaminidase
VTKDRGNVRTPASLSKKWITDILRKKIGYRDLICSDDLEMGGVLAAAPIEQAIIGHIRAGGDLGLICHQEAFILRAHEALLCEMERDARFARRVQESARRVLAFKKKLLATRRISAPTSARVEKLTRQLWEFGEEIRMATLARTGNKKERA